MADVDNFPSYIVPIIALEGGAELTDNPDDEGGPTIYGITAATAAAAGYSGQLAEMTESEAIAIYRTLYWQAPGFDLVDPIFPALAAYLLNVGINLGPETPTRFLQRALNAFGYNGTHYAILATDGQCGPLTRASLTAYLAVRPASQNGMAVLLSTLQALVASNYIAIVETDPQEAAFAYGWLRARAFGLPESAD